MLATPGPTLAFVVAMLTATVIGCSPKAGSSVTDNSLPPLTEDKPVLVLDANRTLPDGCRKIGNLTADAGGAECHYSTVIANAQTQARKMGGNILKITRYWEPAMGNPCYKIRADVLFSADADQLAAADQARKDSLHRAKFGDHPNYAILYAYRPSGVGPLIGYNLHLGDSVICRMKNNSKYEIRLYKEGPTTLWASKESKSSIPLTVKFGEEYYLKCVLLMGAFVGEPRLGLIAKGPGETTYESIK
ncbi:MAG TPA: hypothetical protein VHE34_15405 [Puia sp.]|uniref:hypothetical protein n=1 Tax=Puia sp. TaxID=2045100 RepID=UPI002BBA0EA7|nr:hypothetical protein [Puia sp.]HVU96615.1 hypothetical protein [Puia sp.]